MTSDSSGNVYIADTGGIRITKVRTGDGVSSYFAPISQPNAVFYDYAHNRLLVTSNVWWTPVYAVDLADSTVSPVTTVTGQFSGLAQDQLHNTYIAFFAQDHVLRVDSNLTGSGETVASGHVYPNHVFSLADSVWAEDVVYQPGNTVEVVIHARNCVPARQFQIPVTFAGDLTLEYDSFSTIGCRTEWYDTDYMFSGGPPPPACP